MTFEPGEIAEVVDLYASNPAYWRAAGEHDPEHIDAAKVEADLRAEAAAEGGEVLLGRDEEGRLVGIVCLLARHPVDGLPWIGLLMVSGNSRRTGLGRKLVALLEQRYRAEGRHGLRLAVLENNPDALAFWRSLGWHEIDRRTDTAHSRPCIVMHKPLA
ncbi:GNAT family N-acetyltransferase [Streptomyces sp. OfavH-34-F]|uniref:GNAT family N-acetyltransferase n=1 Tax=Streptomyces sp. OfavH-34-F TaxID=2917760 RepID=UPI001EF246D6|nr:GNAT family N-acetyltransferase [Streptomyces sp. OfavH-34-F]MCG7524523.1 GNAT family N-acetyltransferase [Streptomyces sp. OfavH-34-F]